METNIKYEVHRKEKFYFAIKLIAGILGYFLIYYAFSFYKTNSPPGLFAIIVFYASAIVVYLFLSMGLQIGHIKGNAVKITPTQFPDIYRIVERQSNLLELSKVPDVYLLQSGGVLNAFATKFLGSNYVIIYSDVLEEAYESNVEAIEFIIGHELGHVKRNHLTKKLLLFPSFFVPFLNSAYSRGCEYTCDNIGAALNPKGAQTGLMLLASGKKLWRKVKFDSFVQQEVTEQGFWFWFAEKVSTHPRLTKRLGRFPEVKSTIRQTSFEVKETVATEIVSDHSSFMPK